MSDDLQKKDRPLSPHLQVYRLPYNALMSIGGRGVGIVLSLSLILVLGWFNAVVWQPSIYDQTMVLLDNPLAKYAGLAWAFLIFFYIGNGLRHVSWDIGWGVNQKSGIITGNIVLLLSALLTLGLWCITCDAKEAAKTDETTIEEGNDNAE